MTDEQSVGLKIHHFKKGFPEYQAHWMQHEVFNKGKKFSDFHGWLEPPSTNPTQIPDPALYWIKPVYFFNPFVDPEFVPFLPAEGLTCPKGHRLSLRGQRAKAPRTVITQLGKFYVQGARLQCTANCRSGNYSTIHPDFVKSLPEGIKSRLPCPITSTKMVSKDISIQIDRSSVGGTSNISQLAQTISQSHTNAFADDSMKYTTHAEYFKQSFAHDQEKSFLPFGDEKDPAGYAGESIHQQTLLSNYIERFYDRELFLSGCMANTFGTILKADHASIPQMKQGCGIDLHFALMNEYQMIVAQCMVEGDATMELKALFKRIRKRYDNAQQELPHTVYVDKNCCPNQHPCTKEQRNSCKTLCLFQLLNPDIKLNLDLLHWMKRFDHGITNKRHIFAPNFYRHLNRACLDVHEGDYNQLLNAIMKVIGCSRDAAEQSVTLLELRTFCRTRIPPPEKLEQNIIVLWEFYSQLVYNDEALFNEAMESIWDLQLVHVRNGCLSDAEDQFMHRIVAKVAFRNNRMGVVLPVYATSRSTSQLEGYHDFLKKCFKGTVVSIHLGHSLVCDSAFHWTQARLKDMGKPHCDITNLSLHMKASQKHMKVFKEPLPGFSSIDSFCDLKAGSQEVFGLKYAFERMNKLLELKTEDDDDDEGDDCEVIDKFVPLKPECLEDSSECDFLQAVQNRMNHPSETSFTKNTKRAFASHHSSSSVGAGMVRPAKATTFTSKMKGKLRHLNISMKVILIRFGLNMRAFRNSSKQD